jgi:hypothetical protein
MIETLSEAAKILLRLSLPMGKLYLDRNPEVRDYVCVGGRHLNDRNTAAQYFRAFHGLLERGLIRHNSDSSYVLTEDGFAVAQQLNDDLVGLEVT